jgi:hypothetical protein
MQDFILPTLNVSWGKSSTHSLEVRGLGFQDITELFVTHGKEVEQVFTIVENAMGASGDPSNLDVKAFGAELITKIPQVVAHVIALATDMPDRAKAARMPFPVQLQILESTYILTIEETGGLESFFEQLLHLLRSVKQTIHSLSSNQETELMKLGTGT